jgi:hypothetical protein
MKRGLKRWTRGRIDVWSRARSRWRGILWWLAVEGQAGGSGRDEGSTSGPGERYWGWFEEQRANPGRGEIKRIVFTTPGDRSLLERQRAPNTRSS